MSKLEEELASWIEVRMANEVMSLSSESRECRAVFLGPPAQMLGSIFRKLSGDGRLLRAPLADGSELEYPVVLQVEEAPSDIREAGAERSGYSLFNGLAAIRNDRRIGVFLTLVPPGGQASDTHESTRKTFGVESSANEGGAQISSWWNDPFVQRLVDQGLGAPSDQKQLDQAKILLREAVVAADAAMEHDVSRAEAWNVLQRLWELRDSGLDLDYRVSLAAGYPRSEDGRIDADHKQKIQSALVDRFERLNLGPAVEQMKEQVVKAAVGTAALDSFLAHMRSRCKVVTSLRRSMPYYYSCGEEGVEHWWKELTVQKWEALLDEEADTGLELGISCTNGLAFQLKGFVPVVRNVVELQVQLSEGMEGLRVRVTRDAPGGAANRREWILPHDGGMVVADDDLPVHRAPIKYVAEVIDRVDCKKATLKLISLATWQPGFIVCSRTASKQRVPRLTPKKPIEASLEMSGPGRHYLDIFCRPGVEIVSSEASAHGDDDEVLEPSRIGRVAEGEYGMEVEAGGERLYLFEIKRPEGDQAEQVRLSLLADEASAEECSSYFEFHLARNSRRDGGKLPRAVHANGQARSAQLQGWLLAEADRSFYPFVLAPDYSEDWGRRDWSSAENTILSKASFISDPRPALEEMAPPPAFLAARAKIAERVRGRDGNDLVESANLGEWLATDPGFEAEVDSYVRSYLEWLQAAPQEACWCDLGLVMALELDGATLEQVPNAILVSPLHPIRFAWQCLAQRAMYYASRKLPCPAASIMDPDCVPDSIALPLRDAAGGVNEVVYFSVECNSDYWGVLWNTQRLDRLAQLGISSPLDREMGLIVGGISSGFSVSQVHRAMDDVCEMLVAKPVIGLLVSSAAGQNNACNQGILSWSRDHFSLDVESTRDPMRFGVTEMHVFDERNPDAYPDDAEIANLAEDTGNAVQWYRSDGSTSEVHDLAIIAQLETSNADARPTKLTSPMGIGGLVRVRVREQKEAGNGQFLHESRVAGAAPISGDGLADNTAKAIATLEGLSSTPMGYVFAPSISSVKKALSKAEFAAVSSSAVDPACFLGNWLEGTYLWDYELPSYSGRAGDSNGYYLLSQIKPLDLETMRFVLQKLPSCALTEQELAAIVQEVARRGIPTVRGLSAGNAGATGDLGLFIATRLLQDSFRVTGKRDGLLAPWEEVSGGHRLSLVIPVDPFQRYLDDLGRAIKKPSLHRPDLVVLCLEISDSMVRCKLTPIEVKNRSGSAIMPPAARADALDQAKSLSALLEALRKICAPDEQEMVVWKLAYQNLLCSMIGYGFRVYSQHLSEVGRAASWARLQSQVIEAVVSSQLELEVDSSGRLIVIDGSKVSGVRDIDGDAFAETIEISQADASLIVSGDASGLYGAIRDAIGAWGLQPENQKPSEPVVQTDTRLEGDGARHADIELKDGMPTGPSHTAADDEGPPVIFGATSQEVTELTGANEVGALADIQLPLGDGTDQRGLIVRVGETLDGFQTQVRPLNLGWTALNQLNMGVVGDLGTGKTQLLQSLIYQIAVGEEGNRGVRPNVLIFDYKKDYSSEEFVKATGARVIKPQHIPLNLFDLSASSQSVAPWLDRYRFFSDAIDKIYSGIGAVQRGRLKTAIKDAYQGREGAGYPTIYDVYRNYQAALKGDDSVTGIMGDMVDMELFEEDPAKMSNAESFLNGVVVIALNELGQDDRTKNMLVAIMLNVFYERMLKIQKRPFLGKNKDMRVVDSMLLVDEADNIMKYEFDVLRKLLLQGREFGVGVILASQYLSHFKAGGTDYREPLLTWVLHKVPNLKPQELSALGISEHSSLQQLTERIKGLGVHEAMYKTHDVPGEFIKGSPFYRRNEWVRGMDN